MKEVEVKAKIGNWQDIAAKLGQMGCKFSKAVTQKDEIFVPLEINSLPTEKGVPVLRIRESGGKHIFTLKVRLSNGLDKLERETEVTDAAALREIILSIGFKSIAAVVKERTKTKYKDWEICLDEVQGLGSFIEAEQLSEDGESEKIQDELFEFLKSLGVRAEDREHHGYDVLIYLKNNL